MCANVFTCDAKWLEKLKNEQARVVVATWSEKAGAKNNEWLEKLQKLEKEGIPVFVCDGDSCKGILESLGAAGDGETIVFANGKETGRLTPGADFDKDLDKVKEMANG